MSVVWALRCAGYGEERIDEMARVLECAGTYRPRKDDIEYAKVS